MGPPGREVEDRLISVCARKPVAAQAADLESLTQEGDRAGSVMARSSANGSRIGGLSEQGAVSRGLHSGVGGLVLLAGSVVVSKREGHIAGEGRSDCLSFDPREAPRPTA